MEEKKFVDLKKGELAVRDYIKRALGKGGISSVRIEYTPVGERIIVSTSRPGMVIGRRGEKIEALTKILKKHFKLDNPHIDIFEIKQPLLDAQLVADETAMQLERKGSLKFKMIVYRMLQDIMKAGALGVEIVMSGKLPAERARSWRFAQGFLKKNGDPAKVVLCAQAQAKTQPGIVGIKVRILPPDAIIHDRIVVDEHLLSQLQSSDLPVEELIEPEEKPKKRSKKKQEAVN